MQWSFIRGDSLNVIRLQDYNQSQNVDLDFVCAFQWADCGLKLLLFDCDTKAEKLS
jgi:hypothetical protein